MKKQFTVSVTVDAYSQTDAQAKVDLLLGLGLFSKTLMSITSQAPL